MTSAPYSNWVAENALKNDSPTTCTYTEENQAAQFWEADFVGGPHKVVTVQLLNRWNCCWERLSGVKVYIDDKLCGQVKDNVIEEGWQVVTCAN